MGLKALLGFLFTVMVVFLFVVYYMAPFSELEFSVNPKNYNFITDNATDLGGMQFYSKMRFPSPEISYKIERDCSIKKKQDMREGFETLSNLTVLEFYEVGDDEEINVHCNETTRFEEGMFIAGEGGPTKIIKSGEYSVILNGSILLIRDSKCERPNVAIHELMHVLGFTHSTNKNNIMYNFSKCSQIIGNDSLDLIDSLYTKESFADLAFESASAYMHGRYLDVNVSVRNQGLANAPESKLFIIADGKELKEIRLDELEIGQGRIVSLTNIFVKQISIDEVVLLVQNPGAELDKNNNEVKLEISS